MTALPMPPGGLLTVADYVRLGEDDRCRTELQEGSLVITPSPTPRHMIASGALLVQLHSQVPAGFRAIQDVDIDLQLGPANEPGSSR